MQEKRAHEERVASTGGAGVLRSASPKPLNVSRRKPAMAVRARKHAQSSVRSIGIVEMEPDGEHVLKEVHWRLHMGQAVLGAPGAEPNALDTGAHGDRKILVPRNKPVDAG